MEQRFDLDRAYRLPWTKHDNPNGWIEVTTYCQLKCPGCYRGLAEENPIRVNEDLGKVKADVDHLINNRNIQTLSIAGGEPLLYPYLEEVVEYAVGEGLETKVFTNGVKLTEDRLESLKSAGVGELIIHVDGYQKRPDLNNSGEVNELRQKYCDLFRRVGSVDLGFIMPIEGGNFQEASEAVALAKKNSDVVGLMVFISYKDMLSQRDNTFVRTNKRPGSMREISDFISREYHSKPCAYIGKVSDPNYPSWLFNIPLLMGEKVIGHVEGELIESLVSSHRKKTGKYIFAVNDKKTNVLSSLPLAFKSHYIPIIGRVLKHKLSGSKSSLRPQVVLVIDPPSNDGGKWDLCDGCPDAMYHKDNLVPSCLLERIKEGEEIKIV